MNTPESPTPAQPPATERGEQRPTVNVPARVALLIRHVFVPRNPNKLRNAMPEVVQAAKDFIALVEGAPVIGVNTRAALEAENKRLREALGIKSNNFGPHSSTTEDAPTSIKEGATASAGEPGDIRRDVGVRLPTARQFSDDETASKIADEVAHRHFDEHRLISKNQLRAWVFNAARSALAPAAGATGTKEGER